MKYLSGATKFIVLLFVVFMSKDVFSAPVVDAQVTHYSLEPKSGASFNRIEQLSIVILADNLSKEFRSPYTLTYRIIDKTGNIVEDKKENILFTLCSDKMAPVKAIGKCGNYNNIATIHLKSRQTRKPPSTEGYFKEGYFKEGRFWIQENEAMKYPRFEEMEYKIKSYTLTDKSGKKVNL